MNREEIINSRAYQVSKAALDYYNEHHQEADLTDAFEAGAEWDEKAMIEKACKYLQKTLYIHTEGDTDWVTSDHNSVEEFIENFKKSLKS